MDDKSFMNIIYDPYTPRNKAYSTDITCNYPGCKCKAINSHIMQRSKFVKSISESGLVLQMSDEQLQPLIDGDENGNMFMLHSTKNAMSLPLFCDENRHDSNLFRRLEIKDMDLDSSDTYLRLSYRAYCAARAQEQRRLIFRYISSDVNVSCQGEIFDLQDEYSKFILKAMEDGISYCFKCMKTKKYDNYQFYRYTIEQRIPVCLSDCIFIEDELLDSYDNGKPLAPLFAHILPYETKTEVLIGYEIEHKTDFIQKVMEEWENIDNYEKSIFSLLVYANNWCVSPSYFGESTEMRNNVCEKILEKKTDFQMEGTY